MASKNLANEMLEYNASACATAFENIAIWVLNEMGLTYAITDLDKFNERNDLAGQFLLHRLIQL